MKIQRYAVVWLCRAGIWSAPTPAWGVNKEMVQLQTQVQDLRTGSRTCSNPLTSAWTGVIQHLIEQSTGPTSRDSTASHLQKQRAPTAAPPCNPFADPILTPWTNSRRQFIIKQLEDMRSTTEHCRPADPATAAGLSPPPDVLYDNALRDYQREGTRRRRSLPTTSSTTPDIRISIWRTFSSPEEL